MKEGTTMKTIKIEGVMLDMVVGNIGNSEIFRSLDPSSFFEIANGAVLNQYDPDEIIIQMETPSDACFMIINGEVAILQKVAPDNEIVEIARRKPYDVIGEVGLLLNQPRMATVQAVQETQVLQFDTKHFKKMFQIPSFGQSISHFLAARLDQLSVRSFLPMYDPKQDHPTAQVIQLLPMDFIMRHNILPLRLEDNFLRIGFVHAPSVSDLRTLRRLLPGMPLTLAQITKELFDEILQTHAGVGEWEAPAEPIPPTATVVARKAAPRLNPLLKRMVAEGASDLHLSAGRVPRWRIDGDILTIQDAKTMGTEEVWEILNPAMDDRDRLEFKEHQDADFIYALPDDLRFRVNIFHERKGIGAAIRVIPSAILSIEQLGLPSVLKQLCEKPKGLALVTGPTGSGKSTTLAAMIDHVNKTRRVHIITLEDPIEFVHQEELALIHQRQVGHHTTTYARALCSALREDPDILLVGELRDRETIALALEAANTGSLVFGTLQTATAISTISRVIDFFPSDEQNHIRSSLADCLLGVVSQTLCKRIGGGRVAASEILIVDPAVRNLIHEDKTNQILSVMQTKKPQGNRILNEDLAQLVKGRKAGKRMDKVEYEEALSKTSDPEDLARRLGKPLPRG
jgi:twitching motility protein PilT